MTVAATVTSDSVMPEPPNELPFKEELAKEQTEESQKLDALEFEVHPILFETCSLFPFDLFPTCVSVDKTKLNIRYQLFFSTYQVKSILISEIAYLEVDTSLLTASLLISSRIPSGPITVVKNLRVRAAFELQRIVQGLMVGIQEKIDISHVPAERLKNRAPSIGDTRLSF